MLSMTHSYENARQSYEKKLRVPKSNHIALKMESNLWGCYWLVSCEEQMQWSSDLFTTEVGMSTMGLVDI